MIHPAIIIAFWIGVSMSQVEANGLDIDSAPWLRPRSLESYKSLLSRSPFSLPTAEENTELAERYVLTGAAKINDKPVVFIFDKNTQNRLMLEPLDGQENQSNNRLLELFTNEDPKNLRASVLIDGQQTEIRFSETSFALAAPQPPLAPPGAPPNLPNPAPPHSGAPPNQAAAQSINPQQASAIPSNNSGSKPPTRVIRRRVISGQPPAAQPIPGQ